MKHYYVDRHPKNESGYHLVHDEYCDHHPKWINNIYIGMFNTCDEALAIITKTYPNSIGCKHCCPDCS
ncbi:MAG: hypothetical protein QM503_00100 [Bacteroidota bacterium]